MKTFKEFITEAKKSSKKMNEEYKIVRLGFFKPKKSSKKMNEEASKVNELNKLHHNLSKHYSKYDAYDKDAIHEYTWESNRVNDALHKNHGHLDPDLNPSTHHMMTQTDTFIHKHKTPHDIHVYTGIHKEHVLTNHTPKAGTDTPIKIHHLGYTSTSLDKNIAKEFTHNSSNDDKVEHRHMIKIHVPKGHHGAYVAHHSLVSADGPEGQTKSGEHEREFILPRGTKLHVHPQPTVHYTKDKNGKEVHYHVWNAKVAK